ncbi:MAG TPA: hypothetical protein VHY91_21255 [Pirellulales bacterium]|nr:hypothetical protein [Pirellulales bacterium]
MGHFSVREYGPTLAELLASAEVNELGPGNPQSRARALLESLTPTSLTAPRKTGDRDMALACCAAIWLRFDFLDKSHQISQSLDTPEGSFWHGVMHRREPDFANAKYWFRRAGQHELYGPLAEEARNLVGEEMAAASRRDQAPGKGGSLVKNGVLGKEVRFLNEQEIWDPLRFVDLCDLALDASPPLHTFCMRLQQLEWEVMFAHCYHAAAE